MPLNSVYLYLQSKLCKNAASDPNDKLVEAFIIELKESKNINALRLMICMGIDVKSSIKAMCTEDLESNTVIKGFRECILSSYSLSVKLKTYPYGIPPQIRFSIAQGKISPVPYFPCISSGLRQEYSRVSSFYSYMMYVVKINRNALINPTIPDDIDVSEMTRYLRDFTIIGKYKIIYVTRLGRNKSWVFVADKNEIDATNYKIQDKTEEIINRLGFYLQNIDLGSNYVCLEYDILLNVNFYQPDSLTGDWGNFISIKPHSGNEFFLSSPNIDEWGRTRSVTGTAKPFRERVHENFDLNDAKHYRMEVNKLGILNRSIPRSNNLSILKEALERFRLS